MPQHLVEGGMKCVKYLLFVFNFIFWVSASACSAAAVPLGRELCVNERGASVYILIGAGSLVMLVGFFGCCGAVRESQCLLGSFFACLLIIFGAEVAAGVFGFLNKDKVRIIEDVQNFYSTTYNENNNSTLIVSYQKVVTELLWNLSNPCPDSQPETKVRSVTSSRRRMQMKLCPFVVEWNVSWCHAKHPGSLELNISYLRSAGL
uniref:Tetraspanin 2b n=1 Tax=Scophthalmus maximus TaxID=52904 RepID=A0A8D3E6P5_SCOMX